MCIRDSYNYVEYVAHNLALPELREGDFPSDYLEIAKMYRFVGFDMSRFRYESHQPPLYYICLLYTSRCV